MSARVWLGDDAVPWPDTPDGDAARRWLQPMLASPSETWIANVHVGVGIVTAGDLILPISVNAGRRESCYVCSPTNHYATYAQEELRALRAPLLEAPLRLLLRGVGAVLRWGEVDRAVMVDNWLVSTNLHPPISPAQAAHVHAAVRAAFPHHAVVWRSVLQGPLLDSLTSLGYARLPSRQVYLFDPRTHDRLRPRLRKHLRRDRHALERSGYAVVHGAALARDDVPRLLDLYEQLYLGKYSRHNPQFTRPFVEHALRERALIFRALRRDGRIDGVVGFFTRSGVMTTPFFGYDLEVDRRVGLYRLLSALLVREAEARGLLLHQSSGAAAFKRWRGAQPEIEYTVAFTGHLPARERAAWRFLTLLTNGIAKPLLERFEL